MKKTHETPSLRPEGSAVDDTFGWMDTRNFLPIVKAGLTMGIARERMQQGNL